MINHKNTLAISQDLLQPYINYLSWSKEMSLNDVVSFDLKQSEVGRKKAIRNRAPIIPKMQRSSYQRNIYCGLDVTNNVFSTLNIPPLHKATDTMCTTPEAIQLPYNMLYKSIQDPITLPQQSNIDMLFNSYIDQQRNYNVQGISLLAHTTQ